MGFGKSSSNSTANLTPEQRQLLGAQTEFLTGTAYPAYKETLGGAKDVLTQTRNLALPAAENAMNVAGRTGGLQEVIGAGSALTGATGLAGLFDPQYEEEQVQASLQAGRESARETQAGQNAMYGGANSLGSARMALADKSLAGLNAQRQATAAAAARAGVQANKAAAAQALLSAGQTGLTGAQTAAAGRVALAGTPQDLYAKYAQVVFGTPQASTTPNFTGTQGTSTQGKGAGIKFS
jgi:hypothetical protein